MFCPNCGNQVPDGSGFCSNCGARLGGAQNACAPQNAYAPQYAAARESKGPPVVLVIGLVIFLLVAGVIAFFVRQSVLDSSPLHGAKLKKQDVWQTEDLSVAVTGLHYDETNDKYPFYITLAAKNRGGASRELRCEGFAINGIQINTKLDLAVPAGGDAAGELRISSHDIQSRVGLERFSAIDLALGAGDAHSGVIHLKTGLKMPEAHLSTGEDEPLYNENGVRINHTTFYPAWPALELYMENDTDRSLAVRQGEVSVSGGAARTPELEDIFLPHTRGYIHLEFFADELEADGLLPMKDLVMKLYLCDPTTGETVREVPIRLARLT